LIARCPVDKLNTTQKMEQHGFLLLDTLLYLEHNLMQTSLPDAANTTHIRPFAQHDVAEVAHTAAEMFQNYASHYAADPRLDQKKCDEVYVSWAVRSCLDRTVADEVLVAKQDGQIVGFGVLNQPDPTTGDGRLYGVLPTVQGRGIYRALMVRSLEWCREQGCTRMLYSTQITNVATQKVCARLGFEMSHAYYTFHRWFDETPFQ
jgi:GNAT superfamily N-acetyltransferase